jgi:hypothetical protein
MLKFNPKISVFGNNLFFAVGMTLSMLMFQVFTDISRLKIKIYQYFLIIKHTYFEALHNIFKYKKILSTFFFFFFFDIFCGRFLNIR